MSNKEYFVEEKLKKTPAQISIKDILMSSDSDTDALLKVLIGATEMEKTEQNLGMQLPYGTKMDVREMIKYGYRPGIGLRQSSIPEDDIIDGIGKLFVNMIEGCCEGTDIKTRTIRDAEPGNQTAKNPRSAIMTFNETDECNSPNFQEYEENRSECGEVTNYPSWLENIVPVPKKDGNIRICIDYRDVNKASPKDDFPLPNIHILIDNCANHKLQSFVDCFTGYHQILMHEENAEKTTFTTPWGVYYYRVMLFGLKNTGATYMRDMMTLFHGMIHEEIEVYVDDVIKKPLKISELLDDLKKNFKHLRRYNLKLNRAKCTFGVPTGKLLGFIVSRKGIEMHPSKIKAIKELPPPKNKKDTTQKAIKGQALADYLIENPVDGDYEPLTTYFFDDEVLFAGADIVESYLGWIMFFDGAANFKGVGIGAVLISESRQHVQYSSRRECQRTSGHRGVQYIDTQSQRGMVHQEYEEPDGKPWYHDIKKFLATREYPNDATNGQKRALRRLANNFFLNGEVLYRRTPDLGFLRCVNVAETTIRTSIGATSYMLVYGTKGVIPVEVEIPSLRVIQEAKLDDAEWVRVKQEHSMLIDEKRIESRCHGQLYQNRIANAFNKRVKPRQFAPGQLVLNKIFPHQDEAKGKFAPNWNKHHNVELFLAANKPQCYGDSKPISEPRIQVQDDQ
ncbi:uncharacterized protein LOC142168992 [Nicotiana tabacum]|uniref:Uncharacterized protein LOC142168992 n=1 Tax=Nicotiana tabacum TaxID=4097 RepID=A0AC58SMS6_TOBAC